MLFFSEQAGVRYLDPYSAQCQGRSLVAGLLGRDLAAAYGPTLAEPLPERLAMLIARLDEPRRPAPETGSPEG